MSILEVRLTEAFRLGNLLLKQKSLIQNPLALEPKRSVRPWYSSTSSIQQEGEENFYSDPHLLPVAPVSLKWSIASNSGNSLTNSALEDQLQQDQLKEVTAKAAQVGASQP